MATITPSKNKPRPAGERSISMTLLLLGTLVLFGVISFLLLHKSKHLHDHGHAKPSLLREGEREGGIDGAHFLSLEPELKSEVSKIHNSHSTYTSKLEEIEDKLTGAFRGKGSGDKVEGSLRGASASEWTSASLRRRCC